MTLNSRSCYRALAAHDARFDGVFFVGVTTTKIYCRPVCRAPTPRRDRCRFFSNAAAERRGFRPCLRCRPELAPGAGIYTAVDALVLTLAFRPPFAWEPLLAFLAPRATPGVEAIDGNRYWRTIALDGHRGYVMVEPARTTTALRVEIAASLLPVLVPLLARLRHLFDLDAAPETIGAELAKDATLALLVRRLPGLRVPGAVDGFELALRAILGQQVSVRAATTFAGRLAAAVGEPLDVALPAGAPALTRLAITPSRLADTSMNLLRNVGLTHVRAESVLALARAAADGQLDSLAPGADVDAALWRLDDLPGVGPWTAQYIAMRALHWPDAFPESDLGLRKATGGLSPARLRRLAEPWRPWRPWRAYAALHLWTSITS